MAEYLPPVVMELTGSDDKFARMLVAAKAKLDKFVADAGKMRATIKVEADVSRARESLRQLQSDANKLRAKASITADTSRAREALRQLQSDAGHLQGKLGLDADTTRARTAVDRFRNEVQRTKVVMKVTAKLEPGQAESLRSQVANGTPPEVTAKVKPVLDRDQARRVRAYLDAFKEPIKTLIVPTLDRNAARRVMAYLMAYRDPTIAPIRPEIDPDRAARARARLDDLARNRVAVITARITTSGSGANSTGSNSRNLGPDLSGIAALGTPIAAGAAALANPAILASVAALTAGFLSAGVAVGGFGLAAAHQFAGISASSTAAAKAQTAETTASRKAAEAHALAATGGKAYKQALTASAAAARSAKDAQLAYKNSLSGLPTATQDTAMALFKLKSVYGQWSDGLAKTTMPVFTNGLKLATTLLPKLTPLVKVGATAFTDFENRLGGEASGGGFDRFISKISNAANIVLPDFLSTAHDVISGVAGILGAFLPKAAGVSTSMTIMAQKFAAFGQGLGGTSGFQGFMATASKDAPIVKQAVEDIAKAVGHLSTAMGPLSGSTVKVIDILAQGISKIPTSVLKDIATVLPYIIIGTRAWTIAQAALTLVMDANPIGLVALALVAVSTALVLLWQNSQTARNIMTQAFVDMAVPVLEYGRIALLVFQMITTTFLAFASSMVTTAAKAFGWMPGIGPKLKAAARDINNWKDSATGAFTSGIKAIDGWTAKVLSLPQQVKLQGDISDLTKKISDAKDQLNKKNLPDAKRIKLQADINNWTQQVAQAKFQLAGTPAKKVAVLTATITDWNKQIDAAKKQLASAPPGKKAVLTADITDLTKKRNAAQAEINSLKGKTVTVYFKGVAEGVRGPSGTYTSANGYAYAAGGIHIPGLRKAADGLMTRQAGFSSSPILWGEAGPEAYIPLSKSRQPRSRQIAAKTVGMLGGQVQWGGGGSGATGAAASFASLGAAIPAGVAAGVSGAAGAAHAAIQLLAKGTVAVFSAELGIASPSKKFRSLGAYVINGLVQGLTGSTASVKAATKRIASTLYVDFGDGHSALQKTVAKDDKALLSLAAKRDSVATKLKAANKALAAVQKQWTAEQKSVADSIMQSNSVVMAAPDDGSTLTSFQVIANAQDQMQKTLQFAANLQMAQKNGLSAAMVAQIAAAGVDAGGATAAALAGATKDQIKQLNGIQTATQSAANGVGKATADAMYGAGVKSAQGLVNGLKSQEKAIDAQMLKIAKSMQAAIKKALGIKSPSRVFQDLGQYIPQGLAKGIQGGTHHATGAVMTMSKAVAGAGQQRSYAYAGGHLGGGGTTVINNYTVEVTVQGSVTSERKLADVIQARLLRKGSQNSQTYQPYKR